MTAAVRERILVLEDSADLSELLSFVLEDGGFSVEVVTSGVDALVELTKGTYALALLDLDVPDLSGLGVQRALRDVSAVETIVMSGRGGPWQREAIEVGATACLPKPFESDDLLVLVRRLLGGPPPPPPSWPNDVLRLSEADLQRVQRLSAKELDELPFGAIRVDRAGVITAYNRYEGTSVGRSTDSVIGMRLRDLAPCLSVKEFLDAVAEGYRDRRLDKVLRFVFPFRGGWRAVNLRLYFDPTNEAVWVFIAQRRRAGG